MCAPATQHSHHFLSCALSVLLVYFQWRNECFNIVKLSLYLFFLFLLLTQNSYYNTSHNMFDKWKFCHLSSNFHCFLLNFSWKAYSVLCTSIWFEGIYLWMAVIVFVSTINWNASRKEIIEKTAIETSDDDSYKCDWTIWLYVLDITLASIDMIAETIRSTI